MKKNLLRDYVILLGSAGLIILIDQVTKSIVRNNLAIGEMWAPWPWMLDYARIVHWYNTGVVFGFFQGMGDIFSVLAMLVALAIIYYFPRVPVEDWPLRLAMILQLGGAVGNLIDRIMLGHVTDFISIGTFAVFNVADSCITMAVVVLLIGVFIQERNDRKAKKAAESADSTVKENGPA